MSEDSPVDPDLLRAARHMIERYGGRAAGLANDRVIELTRLQQHDAAALWRRIVDTIRALQRSGR